MDHSEHIYYFGYDLKKNPKKYKTALIKLNIKKII